MSGSAWEGGWWGYHGVPAPGVGGMRVPFCGCTSPELVAGAGVRQSCTRTEGHTGRHAAYGPTETLAVWP